MALSRSCKLAGLIALLSTIGVSRPSHACGYWSVRDMQEKWWVVFYSITVFAIPDAGTDGERVVMKMGPRAREWRVGKGRVFRLVGTTLELDGKTVGRYWTKGIQIAARSYQVQVGPPGARTTSRHSAIPDHAGRRITVSRDATVVLDGVAMGRPHCDEEPIARLALYLAWRDLVMSRHPSAAGAPSE
jgi:hypothetical protein